MTPTRIYSELHKQPFVPFRLHLSDGSAYDVVHPEFAFVTRSHVEIVTKLGEDGVPDLTIYCDPYHVTRIEPIVNGHKPRTRRKRVK